MTRATELIRCSDRIQHLSIFANMSSTTSSESAPESFELDIGWHDIAAFYAQQEEALLIYEYQQSLLNNIAHQETILACYTRAHNAFHGSWEALFDLESNRATTPAPMYDVLHNNLTTVIGSLQANMEGCQEIFDHLQEEARVLLRNVR